jgi:Trypsin-like peptidase domain
MSNNAHVTNFGSRFRWALQRRLCGGAVLAAVAVGLGAPVAAHATVATSPTASPAGSSDAAIRAYWTQVRLRAARIAPTLEHSGDLLAPGLGSAGIHGGATGSTTSSQASASGVTYADGWATGKHYDPRVGKLYFTNPSGQAMVCSGVVVGRNLIMTAGHCVYTGRAGQAGSGWDGSFLFVPGKVGGSNPYGAFTGKNAAAYKAYYRGIDGIAPMPGLDYAFVKLNPRNGHSVGDLVGWDGVTWGNHTAYRSLGYPSEGWFLANGGGNYPWFTHSNRIGSYQWGATGYSEVRIANRANGGTSGGPWLVSINGGEYVNSVNSLCKRGPAPNKLCTYMDGPQLTSAVKSLLTFAKAL